MPNLTLQKLLCGRTTKEFLTDDVGKRSFVACPEDSNRFSEIISFDVLNNLLENHRLEWPRLRLALDGKVLPESSVFDKRRNSRGNNISYINTSKLNQNLSKGATLIFDSIDQAHNPIKELATLVESEIKEPVHVNLYAALSEQKNGFDIHWDNHDVLILQIQGQKRWEVRSSSIDFPTRYDRDKDHVPSEEIVWEGFLNKGEVLYIPRGWWHQAWPDGEPTMHLTFGFGHKTWLDVLGWLKEKANEDSFFRQDIIQTNDWDMFASRINSIINSAKLEDFLLEENAKSSTRLNHVLNFHTKASDVDLVWNGPNHAHIIIDSSEEFFSIGAIGKVWEFDISLLAIFQKLITSKLSFDECFVLAPDIEEAELRTFFQDLNQKNLILFEQK